MPGFLKRLAGKRAKTAPTETPRASPVPSAIKPVGVGAETFDAVVLGSQVPVLVDFWAPWCGPCRMIAPIVEELARLYGGRVAFAKVDVDEQIELVARFGIQSIPTLLLFKGGHEADRLVGFAPRYVLDEKLRAVLK